MTVGVRHFTPIQYEWVRTAFAFGTPGCAWFATKIMHGSTFLELKEAIDTGDPEHSFDLTSTDRTSLASLRSTIDSFKRIDSAGREIPDSIGLEIPQFRGERFMRANAGQVLGASLGVRAPSLDLTLTISGLLGTFAVDAGDSVAAATALRAFAAIEPFLPELFRVPRVDDSHDNEGYDLVLGQVLHYLYPKYFAFVHSGGGFREIVERLVPGAPAYGVDRVKAISQYVRENSFLTLVDHSARTVVDPMMVRTLLPSG